MKPVESLQKCIEFAIKGFNGFNRTGHVRSFVPAHQEALCHVSKSRPNRGRVALSVAGAVTGWQAMQLLVHSNTKASHWRNCWMDDDDLDELYEDVVDSQGSSNWDAKCGCPKKKEAAAASHPENV